MYLAAWLKWQLHTRWRCKRQLRINYIESPDNILVYLICGSCGRIFWPPDPAAQELRLIEALNS